MKVFFLGLFILAWKCSFSSSPPPNLKQAILNMPDAYQKVEQFNQTLQANHDPLLFELHQHKLKLTAKPGIYFQGIRTLLTEEDAGSDFQLNGFVRWDVRLKYYVTSDCRVSTRVLIQAPHNMLVLVFQQRF